MLYKYYIQTYNYYKSISIHLFFIKVKKLHIKLIIQLNKVYKDICLIVISCTSE